MKLKITNGVVLSLLFLLTGCWTLDQTEMPKAVVTRAPEGCDIKVAVGGYAATITDFIPIYGYQTVYVEDGPYHHHRRRNRWYDGHYETITTETLVPQCRASDAFITRAQTLLEDAGYLVRASEPEYSVEVTFGGPFITSGEETLEVVWMFCSILSAEYSTQTWTAKLRVYDVKSGRVLFTKDYSQKYEDCVWSPLFFIGLAGYDKNTYNYMQSWCLSALTDQTVEGATAFLAQQKAAAKK